jgi:CRP/FNR family transcriptional regulator, cyclic AMP receptor protein
MRVDTAARLAAQPFFREWEGDLLRRLAPQVVERTYAAGEPMLREGDPADRFVLVLEGKVALEIVLPDRPAITVQTLGAGEVIGWSWLVAPHRWRVDARAVKSTRTLEVPGASLRAALDANPGDGYRFLLRLLPVIAGRLEHTRIQLLDLHGH